MPSSIDVVFTPALLPFSNLSGKTVVVADILRATTTIAVALANGARDIIPVVTPADAFNFAKRAPNVLIGGERKGVKVKGFDHGNSPREYTKSVVAGRSIVLTTTNGTRTLNACQSAGRVLVGCFLNLRAVVNYLGNVASAVAIACAGREGSFCLEDAVFAGACVEALRCDAEEAMRDLPLTDAAEAAQILYRAHCGDLIGMMKNCYHGKTLAGIGLEADLEFCAQTNIIDVVPRQVDGRIIASSGIMCS